MNRGGVEKMKVCPFCKSNQIVKRKKMKVEIRKNFVVNIPQRKSFFCSTCKRVFSEPLSIDLQPQDLLQ